MTMTMTDEKLDTFADQACRRDTVEIWSADLLVLVQTARAHRAFALSETDRNALAVTAERLRELSSRCDPRPITANGAERWNADLDAMRASIRALDRLLGRSTSVDR